MIAPTAEEFETWLDNPVTQWVRAGVARYADLQKVAFSEAMWAASDEPADWERQRILHARAVARADAYEGFAGLTYDQALGLHEDGAGE